MNAHAQRAPKRGSSPGPRNKVLIVDDSRAIQALIRRSLDCSELGPLDIQTATDGQEALAKVASFQPDLVLSDWHMPGVSGIDMLRTLRGHGFHSLAVGFITTDRASDCQALADRHGALFLLHKPFAESELRRAVAKGLGRAA